MTPDECRAELAAIREAMDRRNEAIRSARNAGLQWPEISLILGMTVHGLIKASRRP